MRFRRAALFFVASVCTFAYSTPIRAQTEIIQIIVPASAQLESTGNRAVIEGIEVSKTEARKNAWRAIKVRPDISLKVRNFTLEQNGLIADTLRDSCQIMLLDQTVDRQLKSLATRFRFDCNQQDIFQSIDNLLRTSTLANVPVANGTKLRLATFFIVKEVSTSTNYDPNINRFSKNIAQIGVSKTDKIDGRVNSDTKSKVTYGGNVRSTEGYGETAGSVADSYSENGNSKTRVQLKGKLRAESTVSTKVLAGSELSSKSDGSVINQAADFKYRSISPEDLNSNLTDVFRNAGIKITHYALIVSDPCVGANAPKPDKVTQTYGNTSEDLSTAILNGIIIAVRSCGFNHLAIGDALVDGSVVDNVTGSPKYTVNVRAKILDISERFPETLATLQKDASSSNPTASKAKLDAIFLASQRAGEEIINRLSAQGVR